MFFITLLTILIISHHLYDILGCFIKTPINMNPSFLKGISLAIYAVVYFDGYHIERYLMIYHIFTQHCMVHCIKAL